MKLWLTDFSVRRPRLVVGITALVALFFAVQFPKVTFDNDPENMLAEDEYVRLLHHEVKERYALYDFVIVGIVNESHADGVFNVETLGRIHRLTYQLLNLHQADGVPAVRTPQADGGFAVEKLNLQPDNAFRRLLNVVFRHDPRRLFGEDGSSAIIGRELIGPSVVDNIRQAELGALKIEYLMERAPATEAEAQRIRDDAMSNPLYRGTLVSENGKALCLYIPIQDKTYSYNVANLVRQLTAEWSGDEQVYITGLPVAEDTFGVEMLVQMATSAPLAGLTIFLLLLLFFRRLNLILAPMFGAIVSVVCAMGMLIGLGFDVHIMSSMIAIFLMPIAVVDSVHMLSEFFDTYRRFHDKAATVRHVVGHLFMPMLYTSLTTMAGFASLAFTPIPPVRVFGLHVAFGVGMAWLLTVTFIPAFIMLFVSERSLGDFGTAHTAEGEHRSGLLGWLRGVGAFTFDRWRWILAATLVLLGVAGYGISRIRINDNPVKWFTRTHPIREADAVLNRHFGGTYTAYLTLAAARPQGMTCREKASAILAGARERFAEPLPDALARFETKMAEVEQAYASLSGDDHQRCFVELVNAAEKLDREAAGAWNALADAINYLEPEALSPAAVLQAADGAEGVPAAVRTAFRTRLANVTATGPALQEQAIAICDQFTRLSFRDLVLDMETELSAPLFKQPEMLRYVEGLQRHLAGHPVVGKTSSAVDALKKANYELNYLAPPADDASERQSQAERNRAFLSVPPSAAAAGQVFTQLESMKKRDSLFHMVTRDYQQANIWVQLKSGDNMDMAAVVAEVASYLAANPPPVELRTEWAGLTYLNVVWQDKMVSGMLWSLAGSFVVVLVMMVVLFRSPLLGLLSMIPLSVTILLIYGLIGLAGKDYDMPVAVLSSLTLGLSVDFAIHFLQRARELVAHTGSWHKASAAMFGEPAAAITRNAVVIAVGFLPLLVAPLVPYKTVGFFLATIMAVSGAGTLFILPALLTMLQGILFADGKALEGEES